MNRILRAARAEFVAKGIAGARMESIAKRARTSKRLPFYYFKSKNELFRTVLRAMIDEQKESVRAAAGRSGLALVETHREHSAHPDVVRMQMWEALEAGERKRVVDENDRTRLYRLFVSMVEERQQSGSIPHSLNAEQLALSLYAMLMFPVAFPALTRMITGYAPSDSAFVEERSTFLAAFESLLASASSVT